MLNINTRVVTGPQTKLTFPHLFEPFAFPGAAPKYSVQLRISKDDQATIEKINMAFRAAYESGKDKLRRNNGYVPPFESLKSPLRDGDLEHSGDKGYANCMFMNASSKDKPGVVDKDLNEITDPAEVYSGCYGRVSITMYAYNFAGNCGIGCALNNVQKLDDGMRMGNHPSPADDFADSADTGESGESGVVYI